MTDPDPSIPENAPPTSVALPPPPERVQVAGDPPPRTTLAPLAYVAGFLVLCAALFVLWRYPARSPEAAREASRIDTLEQQLHQMTDRVAALEGKTPPTVDLGPLESRIARLEQRPAPSPAPVQPATPTGASPGDLTALSTRLDTVASQQTRLAADTTALNGKLEANASASNGKLEASAAALTAKLEASAGELGGKIGALDRRVAAVESQQGQVAGLATRAQLFSRLQTAGLALEQGQRLGDIPGAPPALARYAIAAPPTEAALRLSYPAAADAAHRASQPAIADNQGFFGRAWVRAQQSVTVRQGDRVMLGDPIAGVLAHAQEVLDAGDLGGAVKVLDQLAGPAKAAMADWLAQAHGLIEARAALAEMAAKG